MISCDEALERISLELDGLLDEEEQAKLNEHLAQCASCRLLREDLQAIHRELPALDAEAPADLTRRVLEQIKPLRKRSWGRRIAGLAACALLCAGLWLLRPGPERPSDAVRQFTHSAPESATTSPQEEEPVLYATAAAAPALDELEGKRSKDIGDCAAQALQAADPGAKGRIPPGGRSNIWPDPVS